MKKQTWNSKFMSIAKNISQWSKDISIGVGAVIVKDNRIISTGYNGFPERIDDEKPERHERPTKYFWTVHAEENSIINCARIGVSTEGADMYCTWFPCASCARMIVNAGIKKIICGQKPDLTNERFGKEFEIVLEMLHEADVDIEYELLNRNYKIDGANLPEDQNTCGCKGACGCID
jgi:dCMP deaminase